MPNLRGIYVLRENITALLRARNMTQDELARGVHHKKSWLNKFLAGTRQIQLRDVDALADYLGVSTYQLFQPGIARASERRVGERRTGKDRRVGPSLRAADEVSRTLRPDMLHDGRTVPAHGLAPAVKTILAETERRLSAYYAALTANETPTSGPRRARAPRGRRVSG